MQKQLAALGQGCVGIALQHDVRKGLSCGEFIQLIVSQSVFSEENKCTWAQAVVAKERVLTTQS